MTRFIGLIPLRSGSKRLPNKNRMVLGGKEIYQYTVDAALNSRLDHIIISSDYSDLVLPSSPRLIYHSRSHELASDSAKIVDLVDHLCINKYLLPDDVLCLLYATAPLRDSCVIDNLISMFSSNVCSSAMAVTPFVQPVHQALSICKESDSSLLPVFPTHINKRATDAPSFLVGNGSTYLVSVSKFLEFRSFYISPIAYVVMPEALSQDLDTLYDFEILKLKFNQLCS